MKTKFHASIFLLSTVVMVCLVGPIISGYSGFEQNLSLQHLVPSWLHWFGTDSLGRDIFTRVCLGGRNSLLIAFACTCITTIIGCLYGGVSAHYEKLDRFLMSVLDIFASIPSILVVIIIPIWFDSKNILVVILAICITGWCKMARLTRNLLKPIRMAEYIFVAKSFKKSPLYIVTRHMIPNIFPTILSRMILSIPEFIFYESFLSYLGIGVQPPDTSWGSLISNAQSNFMFHPYQLLFSSLFLILIMLSITWMGECIGTKFADKEYIEDDFSKNHLLIQMNPSSENLLQVQNLSVHYSNSLDESVKNVSFEICPGEIVGLVGDSGCGKTTIARTLSGIITLFSGHVSKFSTIRFDDEIIDFTSEESITSFCKTGEVSIIYQDAHSHLDPTMRVGEQIAECISLKENLSDAEMKQRIFDLMTDVGLGIHCKKILSMYPYQLSGGIAQRIIIAMAIATRPRLLICDEPTASLDAILKRQVVRLIKKLAQERQTAVLFITHDIELVKEIASRIMVMANGVLEDMITVENLLTSENKYTRQLLNAIPSASCLKKDFHTENTVLRLQHIDYFYPGSDNKILNNISLKLKQGETFGILGESGSGKTTLARIIAGHMTATSGVLSYSEATRNPQYIFQNAFSAFDPLIQIGDSILEGVSESDLSYRQAILDALLENVDLAPELGGRLPSELSIGQCQRAAIARALAVNPSFVICDEPTSALDTINQKHVLDLLYKLIHEEQITCIFISHDVDVVHFMADRIAVMYKGHFVEIASADELFCNPCHPYTKMLLSDYVYFDYNNGEIEDSIDNRGCPYYNICQEKSSKCATMHPTLKQLGQQSVDERHHYVACLLFTD